jgi:hypothetical protein
VPNILHLKTLKKLVPAWIAATRQFNGVKNDWQDEQVGTFLSIDAINGKVFSFVCLFVFFS